MRTITVQELHQETDRIVREAALEEIVVMENGQPLAILNGLSRDARRQQYWNEREQKLAALPMLDTDSTAFISEDRDRG